MSECHFILTFFLLYGFGTKCDYIKSLQKFIYYFLK